MPTPSQPPKPSTPPSPPPKPPEPKPEAAKATSTPPIGAMPADPNDPQAIKFEQHAVPPRWEEPKPPVGEQVFEPRPALDPRAEQPPQGAYADGMGIAEEQRLRSAWIEEHGLKAYDEATDQRADDEKPKFDPHALAGGGAFVSPSAMKQVAGVVPPTKRE